MTRILIVDDNLMIRTLLDQILNGVGHEIVGHAADGIEAEALARALTPELVILDLVMPARGGLETIPELLMIYPQPVVVVCSASHTRRHVLGSLHLGAAGFIVKPFKRCAVIDGIEAALGRAAANTALLGGDSMLAPVMAGVDDDEREDERREFSRHGVGVPIQIDAPGAGAIFTRTLDLSGGGASLAQGGVAVGAKVIFKLLISPDEPPIEGRARVARRDLEGRAALAFEYVSVEDHERLIAYLNSKPSLSAVA